MNDCLLDMTKRALDSYAIMLCIVLIGICISIKQPKLALFAFVLTAFYMFGYTASCYYRPVLGDNIIYIYGIWALLEFLYIFVLSILAHYRKVRVDQVAYSSVITFFLITTYMLEMFDRVYWKSGIITSFDTELIFAGNVMFVAIAYFPLFIMFYYKFILKKDIPYSNWHE
jgi:hypothetical protein